MRKSAKELCHPSHLSEDGVLAVQPVTGPERKEKLAVVIIPPPIRHRNQAPMHEAKPAMDLILEGSPVDRLACTTARELAMFRGNR